MAEDYKKVVGQLTKVKEEFKVAQKEEENLIRARDISVDAAKTKIKQLGLDIEEMRRSQSMAELHQAASGMITDIGGTGDTINRLDEIVQKNKNEAIGAARIARSSVDMAEINETEQERTALANAALAEFAAANGLAIKQKDNAPVEPAQKTMGAAPVQNA